MIGNVLENIENINIETQCPLISPEQIKSELPAQEDILRIIKGFREEVIRILDHEDNRFLVVTGPCSIHDTRAAMDYAQKLKKLRDLYKDKFCIVMRVYFEKPRTSLGWRGQIIDPDMDGSYKINEGIRKARDLLLQIARMGIPAGTEILDPIVPQYIADLVTWASIGARTTESQIHRELASGLSMPVGFKNGTDGDLETAVNAVQSALHGHSFIGIDQVGRTCIFNTKGNHHGHIIMRGGKSGPNYYESDVESAEKLMDKIGVKPSIIIDCSHANSNKNHELQADVCRAAFQLRQKGYQSIRGIMLESHLIGGRQDLNPDISKMIYGQSITDACMGWVETEKLLAHSANCFNI